MKTPTRLASVALVAGLLGGCQSFPLTSWMFRGPPQEQEADRQLAANTAGALEEGRASLEAGHLAEAIALFRVAQTDLATRADATNGLGVAYARLGRPDLAERYFQAAITADPENTVYVANLLRLQQQTLLARRSTATGAQVASRVAPERPVQPANDDRLASNVDRISRGEVRINTRSNLGNAPAMALAYGNPAATQGGAAAAAAAAAAPIKAAGSDADATTE